jgi:sterol desaturase/sphingolipid hydroxylase (fatty acid hydroxylase superfamily)
MMSEWVLDGIGLAMQGVVVPILQTTLLFLLLNKALPGFKGCLSLSAPLSFLLNFVVVDYAYYWNHRLLHGSKLWSWHAVHHTAQELDVFVTSRNTLWVHFLIVYVWINALGIFLLKDPTYFLFSAALTAMLDLWRHSALYPKNGNLIYQLASGIILTPHDHAWHHSNEKAHCNFGANLKWWDQIHKTYYNPGYYPSTLGMNLDLNLPRKLLLPFKAT